MAWATSPGFSRTPSASRCALTKALTLARSLGPWCRPLRGPEAGGELQARRIAPRTSVVRHGTSVVRVPTR
jgi:hypothetical protein